MIAAGLLAFVLTVALLQDRSTTATVLVANTEILPGAAVTNDMVSEVDLPATSDLVNSIVAPDLFTPGMIAAQRVAAGDPLTKTALAPLNSTSGMRAMSLPIDRINAVGGDLTPGDRVDIIGVDGATARYVAVDLEVLATQSDPSATGALASGAASSRWVGPRSPFSPSSTGCVRHSTSTATGSRSSRSTSLRPSKNWRSASTAP